MLQERIVALDYGKKRIGLAYSDPSQTIGLPQGAISVPTDATKAALHIAAELFQLETKLSCRFSTIVIGRPLLLKGTESAMTKDTDVFSAALAPLVKGSIVRVDERLSSLAVDRSLRALEQNRKERSHNVDAATAALLLQEFLSALKTPLL